jgi:FKBP-type peptidyl-prolyl cis-trans isomerase
MLRSIAMVTFLLCGAARAGSGDNPAAQARRTAPADATVLPSGVAWKTLVAGTGATPGPHDWVALYGATDNQGAMVYFMAKPVEVDKAGEDEAALLVQMKVGEKRRLWLTSGHVQDLELAAILPGPTPDLVTFPPPSDATPGASGIPSVVLRAGRTAGAVSPTAADVVLFDAGALGVDGKPVQLAITPGSTALGDVPFAPVADVLREMVDGEERFAWVPAARNQGTALMLHVTLVHTDHRAQRKAPADLHPPHDAVALPSGASYVVLARGTGAPPVADDEVVIDLAVWTDAGRTIADEHGTTELALELVGGLSEQVEQMRAGEKRRVWLPPAQAGMYSEGGRGAVVEVALTAIHRNFDLLPDGMRIELDEHVVTVVRGGRRAALPLVAHHLAQAKLSADRTSIEFLLSDDCERDALQTMTLDAVRARLEDAAASAEHDHARAAAGFRRAIALDGDFADAYVRLAGALAAGGDKTAAALALAPLAKKNPVWVAWRLADDPALAGVAQEPDLSWLHGGARGHVDVATMPAMIDPSGTFLAAPVTEGSWGSGDSSTRIEILDLRTGAIVATIPDVMWNLMTEEMTPAIQAQVAQSKARVEGILDDLGFAAPDAREEIDVDPQDKFRGSFAKARLVLELGDRVHVLRAGVVVADAPPVSGHIEAASWLPSARLVVLFYGRPGSEGCEGTDPQGVAVIRVP